MVIWLPKFKSEFSGNRSRYSVEATKAIVNLNNIAAEDVAGDVVILVKTIDMLLYWLATY